MTLCKNLNINQQKASYDVELLKYLFIEIRQRMWVFKDVVDVSMSSGIGLYEMSDARVQLTYLTFGLSAWLVDI